MRSWFLVLVTVTLLQACGQLAGLGEERSLAIHDAGPKLDASTKDVTDADAEESGDSGVQTCTGNVLLWTKRFGDAGSQTASAMAPDGEGGVYLAGYFEGGIAFGDPPLVSEGSTDLFVAHLDSNGHEIWSQRFGDATAQGGGITVTPANDGVILAGELRGTTSFGGTPHIASGFADGFIAKLDTTGKLAWVRFVTGPSLQHSELVTNVQVDASGDLYLSAVFTETVTFMNQTFTSAGMKDFLFAKLEMVNGLPELAWAKQFGADGDEAPQWVDVDESGIVYLGGGAAGALSLGQAVLPSTLGWDAVFGVYDSNDGSPITTRRYGGAGDTGVTRLTGYSTSSDFFVTGRLRFGAEIDFGNGLLASPEGTYVARLHEDLEPVAARAIDNLLVADGAAVSKLDVPLVGGTFRGTADVGSQSLTSVGLKDGILLELEPDLDTVWSLQVGSTGDDEIHAVTIDPTTGDRFAFGHFRDKASFTSSIGECADLVSQGGADLFLLKLAP